MRGKDGKTPLFYATEQGRVQLMQLLLEAGAKTDEPEFAQGWTPLFTTVRNPRLNTPRFRIENGAAKGQGANAGTIPLLLAAGSGHLDIA